MPPRFQPEPVLEDPRIAPPYCDLYFMDIDTAVNHETKQVSICGVVGNLGSAPPSGAIRIFWQIYFDFQTPTGRSQTAFEEWRWYHAGTALPFRTDWMSVPLIYAEDGGGEYLITLAVGDEDNRPGDANDRNDRAFSKVGPVPNPALFTPDTAGPLRIETMGDGTRTVTLAGKALKVGRRK